MNETPSPVDPYDVVLADLRAQRDRIDSAIAALTALRGGGGATIKPSGAVPEVSQSGSGDIGPGALLGMSIADATIKVLTARKRKMTNAEILADLKAGGLVLTSKDPMNVVNSVLNRRFLQVGDVVRVERGTWGLKIWYPGRNFNKGKATVSATPSSPDSPSDVDTENDEKIDWEEDDKSDDEGKDLT